jgi:hypothetical protein
MKFVTSAMVAAVVFVSVAPATAQQPGHPHGPGPAPAPAGAEHQSRHMDMCRQMMGHPGMMGGMMGMMPMMGGGDPRQQAETMAMRGEMMKAMGDIMIKYAQRLQPAK